MSLENKIIVNFGDSIFGNFRAPEDISSYIAEITGAKTYNVGFGGCRMSVHSLPHFDKFCMYRIADAVTTRDFQPQEDAFDFVPRGEALPTYFRDSFELLRSIDFSKVDIATIAYGTNDFTAARPLEGAGKYDFTTYGGALRYSIEKLESAFPSLTLGLCSQTYRFWRKKDTGEEIGDSNTRAMESGLYLPEFVEKTREIADEYGLFFIDNYNGPVINKENRDLCFSETDSTHPIPYGRRLIAENISRNLIERFGK